MPNNSHGSDVLPIEIVRYAELGGGQPGTLRQTEWNTAIDQIFFEASSVQAFRDDAHRRDFYWLWLGRYLIEEPETCFIALNGGNVCGYLVGSLEDPAPRTEFAELSYFQDFARLTPRFPAHLHINVNAESRNHGVGQRLVETFEEHVRACGLPGMHIVTGAGMRNVRFYERLGFGEVGRAARNGGFVVMLAKSVAEEAGR